MINTLNYYIVYFNFTIIIKQIHHYIFTIFRLNLILFSKFLNLIYQIELYKIFEINPWNHFYIKFFN